MKLMVWLEKKANKHPSTLEIIIKENIKRKLN